MAYLGGLAYHSWKLVRQFLYVNFAYANSYMRNAIHETFLRTKNRKSVHKYTHGLSCRNTENFRKVTIWRSYFDVWF